MLAANPKTTASEGTRDVGKIELDNPQRARTFHEYVELKIIIVDNLSSTQPDEIDLGNNLQNRGMMQIILHMLTSGIVCAVLLTAKFLNILSRGSNPWQAAGQSLGNTTMRVTL